jgi:hypothetical protein
MDFVEQKLKLNCSFRFDQIFSYHSFKFGHTLLCYLSRTLTLAAVILSWRLVRQGDLLQLLLLSHLGQYLLQPQLGQLQSLS